VLVFVLIVIAGAIGTFIGIITVVAKNERTTNRNQLLSNIGGSIALASIVCLVPGGLVYVFTDSIPITLIASVLSGFVCAWVIEEIDH
jgi:O-antigen/teichoic acid export membrane protein